MKADAYICFFKMINSVNLLFQYKINIYKIIKISKYNIEALSSHTNSFIIWSWWFRQGFIVGGATSMKFKHFLRTLIDNQTFQGLIFFLSFLLFFFLNPSTFKDFQGSKEPWKTLIITTATSGITTKPTNPQHHSNNK